MGGQDSEKVGKLKSSIRSMINNFLAPPPERTPEDYPDLPPDEAEDRIEVEKNDWMEKRMKIAPRMLAQGVAAIQTLRHIGPKYKALMAEYEKLKRGGLGKPRPVDRSRMKSSMDDDEGSEESFLSGGDPDSINKSIFG